MLINSINELIFRLNIDTQSKRLFGKNLILLLIVLGPSDPHVFKRWKTCQYTATLPTHSVPLGRGEDSRLYLVRQDSF